MSYILLSLTLRTDQWIKKSMGWNKRRKGLWKSWECQVWRNISLYVEKFRIKTYWWWITSMNLRGEIIPWINHIRIFRKVLEIDLLWLLNSVMRWQGFEKNTIGSNNWERREEMKHNLTLISVKVLGVP